MVSGGKGGYEGKEGKISRKCRLEVQRSHLTYWFILLVAINQNTLNMRSMMTRKCLIRQLMVVNLLLEVVKIVDLLLQKEWQRIPFCSFLSFIFKSIFYTKIIILFILMDLKSRLCMEATGRCSIDQEMRFWYLPPQVMKSIINLRINILLDKSV